MTRWRDERGAVLVQTGIALIGLLAMGTLTVDYGMLWVARRQAQNAADSAALAGAISLAFGDPSDTARIKAVGVATAQANRVWGEAPNVTVNDVYIERCPPGSPGASSLKPLCVRVEAFRNQDRNNPLPTWFGGLVGVTAHGVKATATAQVASGNQVTCMLPFAVIDRWADNHDPTPVTTFFPNDGATGIDGWTPNDSYLPPTDVYVPPYDGNTGHTGWKVTSDFGRQLILKDGSVGNYSTGWSQLVCLNGDANCSADDVRDWLVSCSPTAVGIANAGDACSAGDEPHGCIDVKTGSAVGPVAQGVKAVVDQDAAAAWNPTADGPAGPGKGAVTGGQGMSSPRIRGMVVLDINHYVASGCTGGTCVGKVANIIGFFLEGICKDVTLDAGLNCDDPSKDIVGRIVTLPAQSVGGVGTVEESASFLKRVILVR